jgi:hypothetical protein
MELCILGIIIIGVADELLNSGVVAHVGIFEAHRSDGCRI